MTSLKHQVFEGLNDKVEPRVIRGAERETQGVSIKVFYGKRTVKLIIINFIKVSKLLACFKKPTNRGH